MAFFFFFTPRGVRMATDSTGLWFKAAAGGRGNGDFKTAPFVWLTLRPQTLVGGLSSGAGFNQTEWDRRLKGRPVSPTPGARRRCFMLSSAITQASQRADQRLTR